MTCRAVELALAGDLKTLRLCVERILPVYCERAVKFALPRSRYKAPPRGAMTGSGSTWVYNR